MSETGEKDKENKEKKQERFTRNTDISKDSRYNPDKIRTGSRYDPKNIKSGSRYDREEGSSASETGKKPETGAEGVAGYIALLKAHDPVTMIMTALGSILIIAYLVMAVYFARRFYPGTTILGINCTGKESGWVKEQVQERVESHVLTLKERYGVSEALTAQSIGMHYVDDGAIDARLKRQYSLFWPVMMLVRRGTPTPIQTAYDADRIGEALQELGCFRTENVIEPHDAYLGETDEGYEIVPEEMGTKLDPEKVRAAVIEALDHEESEVILEFRECYIDPEIYSDDEALAEEAEKKNALLGADLIYDFEDRSEHLDTAKIMEFVVPDGEDGYMISEDAVYHYANELADRYDTFGGTRTFYSSIGTVETLYGGDYGWAMDREATGRELLNAIREKRTGKIDPVYMYTAGSRAENDIGSTYVEICIKRQEMWCYKDGELVVDTPVVTGNPSQGNATPSGGVWAIDAKMTDYVLVGEGYRSPVDFWMPFNGNIGIHDMQTRYYFGSTIYLTHGSHGCVNTPLEAVEQIYNTVKIGTPVIVYEGNEG
ncbi:MAG: L,D-transpeptidase family protein [Lachnospiraceae bacterium]|nr:L,D-transpeptidase family protein [Lachnospiraceae bacterium]